MAAPQEVRDVKKAIGWRLVSVAAGMCAVAAWGNMAPVEGLSWVYEAEDGNAVLHGFGMALPGEVDGASVATIGDDAFRGCAWLKAIVIPESVKSIGAGAFAGCSGLAELEVPSGVESIGSGALEGCSGLKRLSLPPSWRGTSWLETAGGAPEGCGVVYRDEEGGGEEGGGEEGIDESEWSFAVSGGRALVLGVPDREGRIDIPETLGGCPVTTIEMFACEGRNGITAIGIPAGVTSIDPKAFRGCPALTSLEVAEDNPAYVAVGGFLYSRNMETLVLALETTGGDIEIPAGVKYIGSFAFGEECQVTSMVFPEGLLSLGDFALCFSGVSTLTVPESVEAIGAGVFLWCPGLKTLYLPSTWKDTSILDDSGGVPPGCKVVYVPTRAERRYADWVREWGADPEELPASGDKDGDGVPNWDEFLAGTNPLDPADTLQASIRAVDGHLRVQPLHAASGRVYRVSGTPWLVSENGDSPVWSSVDSDKALEDGELRFFRVGAELAEE
jgi:hypothetical protein